MASTRVKLVPPNRYNLFISIETKLTVTTTIHDPY